MAGQRMVGDYVLTQRLGKGSFAEVWKGKHRLTGAEVAIKEIAMDALTRKLRENLMSEINILKKINHPNIIRLYDTILVSNRICLVLEFCAGGDLGAYINQHGKVPEATVRHFMRQLGAGLQVLQANNLIHRDLKPQNLLLSSTDTNAVLKMADFGFARSLEPQGMAETLCGSPLYMAPEILQSKKYNAKADLWSVGTILYQLMTGQPPFTGQSPYQLLQNIQNSTSLNFPNSVLHPDCIDLCRKLLRKDPVARLSFEEFFSHKVVAEPIRRALTRCSSGEKLPFSVEPKSFPEDTMPFPLEDDPPFDSASSKIKANLTYKAALPIGFQASDGLNPAITFSDKKGIFHGERANFQNDQFVDVNWKANKATAGERARTEQYSSSISHSKGIMIDSMEVLEKEYVLVSVPTTSTDGISFSESDQFTCVGHQPSYKIPQKFSTANAPLLKESSGLCDAAVRQGGRDIPVLQADFLSRLHGLHKCAETIEDLAHNKYAAGQLLEAFSLHLSCLAVWKEALSISSTKAGNPNMHSRGVKLDDIPLDFLHISDIEGEAETLCSYVEQRFCKSVEQAEELASRVQCLDGSTEIPDPMEMIYQAALTTGRDAAVAELMGKLPKAAAAYCKAATMLYFLLVEAAALPTAPHLRLGNTDRQRLHKYITIIVSRQKLCAAEKVKIQQP